MKRYSVIAAGGIAGASLRWALSMQFKYTGFPWVIFVINVFGSAVLGVLMAHEYRHTRTRWLLHDFGGIGFCGGLTTMSTFALDVVRLCGHEHMTMAVVYVLVSVIAGITAVALGAYCHHRVRALLPPLGGSP